MRVSTLAAASALTSFAQAVGELPASPIRGQLSALASEPPTDPSRAGVNLGGLFICEPWMMSQEWSKMGCGAYQSEFDCMSHVVRATPARSALVRPADYPFQNAQAAFEEHWDTWITQSDIQAVRGCLRSVRPHAYHHYRAGIRLRAMVSIRSASLSATGSSKVRSTRQASHLRRAASSTSTA